jgi:hypothetical protein
MFTTMEMVKIMKQLTVKVYRVFGCMVSAFIILWLENR